MKNETLFCLKMKLFIAFALFILGQSRDCPNDADCSNGVFAKSEGQQQYTQNRIPQHLLNRQPYSPVQDHLHRIKYQVNQLGVVLLRGVKAEIDDATSIAKGIRSQIMDWISEVESALGPLDPIGGRAHLRASTSSTVITEVQHRERVVEAIFRIRKSRLAALEAISDRSRTEGGLVAKLSKLTEDANAAMSNVVESVVGYDSYWNEAHINAITMYVESRSTNSAFQILDIDLSESGQLEKITERISATTTEPTSIMKENLIIRSLVDGIYANLQLAISAGRGKDIDQRNRLIEGVVNVLVDTNRRVQDVSGLVTDTSSEYFNINNVIELSIYQAMLAINNVTATNSIFAAVDPLIPHPRFDVSLRGSGNGDDVLIGGLMHRIFLIEELATSIVEQHTADPADPNIAANIKALRSHGSSLAEEISIVNKGSYTYDPTRLSRTTEEFIIQSILNTLVKVMGKYVAEIDQLIADDEVIEFNIPPLLRIYTVSRGDAKRIRSETHNQ